MATIEGYSSDQVDWQTAAACHSGGCVEVGVWRKAAASAGKSACVEAGIWTKAKASASEDCLEAGIWATAEACARSGCVETQLDDSREVVLVRDTKEVERVGEAEAPVQAYELDDWQTIVTAIGERATSLTEMEPGAIAQVTLEEGASFVAFKHYGGDDIDFINSDDSNVQHTFNPAEILAFEDGARNREFDLPAAA